MKWNWQLDDWPNYLYQIRGLKELNDKLLQASGVFLGVYKCLHEKDQENVKIELLSEEALKTSAIEGEYLNRDSLQASLCREFGLQPPKRHATAAEQGIAHMMRNTYMNYDQPLNHQTLGEWHENITLGRQDLETMGNYRKHREPMLIVSAGWESVIHFEAPPSDQVPALMDDYIHWFNDTAPNGKHPLPALIRAGIAHVYFESIHPFEDGNGRVGRALVVKAISQCLGFPSLISLSSEIDRHKKEYYDALKTTNQTLEITEWLQYFSEMILKAQAYSQKQVEFLIEKAKFFDKFDIKLNERQRKVMLRMFKEGINGFKGGLSAENYIAITQTSRATATRDLHELVTIGALIKEGRFKSTRYYLCSSYKS